MKKGKQIIIVVLLLFFAILLTNCEDDVTDPSGTTGTVETPEFSVESGTYTSGFSVTISCATEGAIIYYSTESYEDDSYSEYTGAITVSTHTTIWAYASADGMTDSEYTRADYAIIADDSGNLIGNGDFSKGETLWYLWASEDNNADADGSFDSGSAFIDIASPGDNSWNLNLTYLPDLLIENGRIYTLSFDAKASKSRTMVMNIGESGRDLNDDDSLYSKYLWQTFSLTTSTQTFTTEFVMTNPTDDDVEFSFYLGEVSGDVTIDNVSLTVRDPESIDPSEINDENLKQAIADSAGVSVSNLDTLTESSLSELSAAGYSISDLTGINQFTGLKKVRLGNNSISSLEPLVGLVNTEKLYVGSNTLNYEDFSVVTYDNFPKLYHLALSGGDGLDLESNLSGLISMLASFPELNGFVMDDLGMDDEDFATLYNTVIAPRLDDFYGMGVNENDLTDDSLELIANIDIMTWLYIGSTSISDLSILEGNTDLNYLGISDTNVTNLTPLKTLYDAGAFHDSDGSILVSDLGLDLTEGTTNREVIDYLLDNGVDVDWEDGNTTE